MIHKVGYEVICCVPRIFLFRPTGVGRYVELNPIVGQFDNILELFNQETVKMTSVVKRSVERIVPVDTDTDVTSVSLPLRRRMQSLGLRLILRSAAPRMRQQPHYDARLLCAALLGLVLKVPFRLVIGPSPNNPGVIYTEVVLADLAGLKLAQVLLGQLQDEHPVAEP